MRTQQPLVGVQKHVFALASKDVRRIQGASKALHEGLPRVPEGSEGLPKYVCQGLRNYPEGVQGLPKGHQELVSNDFRGFQVGFRSLPPRASKASEG